VRLQVATQGQLTARSVHETSNRESDLLAVMIHLVQEVEGDDEHKLYRRSWGAISAIDENGVMIDEL
jgi:hypothetical protein